MTRETSILAALGGAVLRAFKSISQSAAQRLSEPQGADDPLLGPKAQANLLGILDEIRKSLQALKREPAIARVEVEWLDTNENERLYVCRASSYGIVSDEGKLVSYRAALGRLAEIPAGEEEEIRLPKGRREARVRSRLLVHPLLDDTGWDSLDNVFELLDGTVGLDSIRRLLEHVQRSGMAIPGAAIDYLSQIFADESERQLFFDQKRRKTVDRMELRDQPVLDQYQGSIFRLPLDRQVVLLGPPGAGKTTTLIRRLAQKRTEEALTPDEHEQLVRLGLKSDFMSDTGWVMFSPTELLKLYVREAFNREGVPASSQNLRTWAAERIALGRDVLRFLKGASSGRFTLDESDDILLNPTSPAVAALYDELARAVDASVLSKCSNALAWMATSEDSDAQQVSQQIRSRFRTDPMTIDTVHAFSERGDFLRDKLAALSGHIEKEEREIANALLSPDPTARLRALHELLKGASALSREEDEDDDDELEEEPSEAVGATWDQAVTARALLRLIRSLAEEVASNRTRSPRSELAKVSNWIGSRRPPHEQLLALGRRLQLRKKLRVPEGASRALVFRVPGIYARFRRRCASQGLYYAQGAGSAAQSSVLSPLETDVVILLMLRNARRALQRLPEAAWLQSITSRYIMQVFVDEATDFSAVQLACMLELTHPKLRSWFAAGDFRQRITISGITERSEIEWIRQVTEAQNLEVQEISSEYRQSARLKELAQVLSSSTPPGVASGDTQDDPAPLLGENLSGQQLGAWLAGRIVEVERLVGRLPSIAVFVDSEDAIDPIVKSTATFLAVHNVRIVACRDGRDVGNRDEVRVFDIRHIKGLEFEAVFFIGVDSLARRMPNLFERFIYVGVTRAATFLGVTCDTQLPERLEPIRPMLSESTWEYHPPMAN